MAYSRVVLTGNGTATQFAVNFALDYLLEADVTCRVGNEVDGGGNPSYRAITFLSTNLLQIAGPPAGNGVAVAFERTIDKETLRVNFRNGDQLDEDNLDTAQKQAMMSVHEVLDGRFSVLAQDLDMGGFRIVHGGNPVQPDDIVNKQYVDAFFGASGLFNPANYYTKLATDGRFYNKTEVDGRFYNKTEVDGMFLPATGAPLMDGIATVGTSLLYSRQDHIHPRDTSKADANYTQAGTGAVLSPLITRFTNTLFAHEFGAVGDNATNDYAALQAFLNEVGSTGKEGRCDPGKRYFVSGGDLLFMAGANSTVQNIGLYGMGAQIRTDPTQFRTGLTIQHQTALTRLDETRKVIVEGLRISQFQDANALWGFHVVGSPHVTFRDCTVLSGSDSVTVNQVNYAAFYFRQTDNTNPDTGAFWCRLDNCTIKGAANAMPTGIRVDGCCNAMVLRGCDIANANTHILLARQNTATNSATAQLANGMRVVDCDFEGGQNCISTLGVAGYSALAGLVVLGCRAESITQAFFNYTLNINPLAGTAPYVSDKTNVRIGVAQFVYNPNALTVNTAGA